MDDIFDKFVLELSTQEYSGNVYKTLNALNFGFEVKE